MCNEAAQHGRPPTAVIMQPPQAMALHNAPLRVVEQEADSSELEKMPSS